MPGASPVNTEAKSGGQMPDLSPKRGASAPANKKSDASPCGSITEEPLREVKCLCVCVCVGVCVCVCACVCVCVHVCVSVTLSVYICFHCVTICMFCIYICVRVCICRYQCYFVSVSWSLWACVGV